MTARDRFINLLRKLLLATRERRITWTDTADEETFRLTFNNGMVHIGKVPDPGFPSKLLTATLFNQNNTPIETAKVAGSVVSEEGNLLRELYTLARESALRPDDVLASVEAELAQRIKEVPAP